MRKIISVILSRPFQLITPTVDGDVLAVLARAEASFTPPQVRDLIGFHSVAGVRNSLVRLTTQGIVRSERVGRAYTYRLNRAHVAAAYVVGLAEAGSEVVDRMRSHISAWPLACSFAALFGSGANGQMTVDSDLDVFVVRPDSVDVDGRWDDQVDALSNACTAWTGNDTRVLEMTEAEVRLNAATDRVLADIGRDGIVLAGSVNYLSRQRRSSAKQTD